MKRLVGALGLSVAAIAASVALGRDARAESIDGRVRAGLETGILRYRARTNTELSETRTQFGFGALTFGPIIGYGLGEHALLNGQAYFSFDDRSIDAPGTASKSVGGGLAATIEYVLGDESSDVRPYLAPDLEFDFQNASEPTEYHYSQFTVAGRLGVHAFVLDSVSFDSALEFGYETGSGTQSVPSGGGSFDYDIKGFIASLSVGLSAWFGNKGVREHGRTTEPEDYEYAEPATTPPPFAPAYPQPAPVYPQPAPAYPQPAPAYPQPAPTNPPSPVNPAPAPANAPAGPAAPRPPSTGVFPAP